MSLAILIFFLLLGLMYVKQENASISQAHYNHLSLRAKFLRWVTETWDLKVVGAPHTVGWGSSSVKGSKRFQLQLTHNFPLLELSLSF